MNICQKTGNVCEQTAFGNIDVSVPTILPPQPPTESVSVDGVAYTVPAQVAAEMLRLHLEVKSSRQEHMTDVVSGKTFDQFVALNESNAARVLELDELCETLQEKTYIQAMRIAELEAQLAQPAQPSKPLTDEQIQSGATWKLGWYLDSFKAGVRYAEAAYGIKE